MKNIKINLIISITIIGLLIISIYKLNRSTDNFISAMTKTICEPISSLKNNGLWRSRCLSLPPSKCTSSVEWPNGSGGRCALNNYKTDATILTSTRTMDVTSGLRGWWKLNEKSGTIIKDSISNNNGINKGATNTEGYDENPNGAYNFDGKSNYISNNKIINANKTRSFTRYKFTHTLWIYADDDIKENGSRAIQVGEYNGNFDWGHIDSDYYTAWSVYAGSWYIVKYKTELKTKTWYHIAATFDGRTLNTYLNGMYNDKIQINRVLNNPVTDLNIGNSVGSSGNKSYWWKGKIDDVRIYDRPLSNIEIKRIYCNSPIISLNNITNGLKGWWKLDGNSTDSSSGGNNGDTDIRLVPVAGHTGLAKTSSKFTWTSNPISFNKFPEGIPIGNKSFTISVWIRPDYHAIWRWCNRWKGSCHYRYYVDGNTIVGWGDLTPNKSNVLKLYKKRSGFGIKHYFYGNDLDVNTGNLAGKWSHVAITYDVATQTRIMYLNGVNIGSKPSKYNNELNELNVQAKNFKIGARPDGGQKFLGLIEDVRIYDHAVSPEEVKKIYLYVSYNNGLEGRWLLNGIKEIAGKSHVLDSSGKGHHAQITDATLTIGYRNEPNTAFKFKGRNPSRIQNINSYLTSGNSGTFFAKNAFTVSLWVFGSIDSNNRENKYVITNGFTTGCFTWCHKIGSYYPGGPSWWVHKRGRWYQAEYPLNRLKKYKWYYITGTYDGINLKAYLDGELISTTPVKGPLDNPYYTSMDFNLGSYGGHRFRHYNRPSGFFGGKISDVRIYSRALAPSEIKGIYNYDGLEGWWKLDGNTNDSTENRNKGIFEGTTDNQKTVPGHSGKPDSAYEFDGKYNISIPFSPQIPLGNSPFTISVWIKPNDHNNNYTILGWGELSHNKSSVIDKSNVIKLYNYGIKLQGLTHYFSNTDTLNVITGNLSNKWSHVVLTYDGTKRTMYFNGDTVGSNTPATPDVVTKNFKIGCRPDGEEKFIGVIDDVRIYNRALKKKEVKKIYDDIQKAASVKNQVIDSTTYEGIRGWWEFKGNALDSSGNLYHATNNSLVSTRGNQGLKDTAYLFSGGQDSYLDLSAHGNTLLNDFSTGFTFCSMIYWSPEHPDPDGNRNNERIFDFGDSADGLTNSLVLTRAGNTPTLRLSNFRTDGSDKDNLIDSENYIETGNWISVLVTIDTNNIATIYKNGNKVDSVSFKNGIVKHNRNKSYIGKSSNAPTINRNFCGKMQDVRVYNRALSSQEVKILFDTGPDYETDGSNDFKTTITYEDTKRVKKLPKTEYIEVGSYDDEDFSSATIITKINKYLTHDN